MKALFYAVSNLVWTVLYFTHWGATYGALLGFAAGTAIVPMIGSIAGGTVGFFMGTAIGLVVGMGVVIFHAFYFNQDTDLDVYARDLSRIIGVLLFLIGLAVLINFIVSSWPTARNYPWHLHEWGLLLGFGGSVIVWGSLSMAYTASYYPDEMVERLIRQNHMPNDLLATLEYPTATGRIERFLIVLHPHWLHWVAAVLGFLGTVVILIVNKSLPTSDLSEFILKLMMGTVGTVFCVYAFVAYCAIANALTLVFLKRVILRDMPNLSPHRSRVGLTLVSFFLTLLLTWWTLIIAPFWAAYVAYNAYHTLATSSYGLDKGKHKEKGSADLMIENA